MPQALPPLPYTVPQQRAAFNNSLSLAQAKADPRMAMKAYDRGGLSRGAGQAYQASIDSDRRLAEGIAEAYSGQLSDATTNAGRALQTLADRETVAQQLNNVQSQNAYANRMAALQRQQMGMNFVSGLLGGLLG